MQQAITSKETTGASAGVTNRRREHFFFTGMAVVIVLIVFGGFAQTYYLKSLFGAPDLIPLLHLHGIVFSSWLALFLIQNLLVATNRTRIHRRLGIAGGVIAVSMVIIGVVTAIVRAKQGVAQTGSTEPLIFLAVPLGDMLVFPILVGLGFYFRRRLDVHKRLMLLATISILPAAVARLPFAFVQQAGPLAFFGLSDLLIVPLLIYDFVTRGRVHKATVLGGLLIVASQPLRLVIGNTETWLAFASWLTR